MTTAKLLRNFSVEIGGTVEINLHPSGRRFDGPATIVRAWINPIHGLGLGFIPLGAFVAAVSESDPARREVTVQLAATLS
jgi:hypothetical protein